MGERKQYQGWGRTTWSRSALAHPREDDEVVFNADPRGHLGRGLGRSYGDAALNSGGTLWDLAHLDRVDLDLQNRSVRVGAGVRLENLLKSLIPVRLFVPVTPGTRHVTVGGAIAADVHGKNHHRDGSIRNHITSLTIKTGEGQTLVVSPGHELFEATVGGMGLTGLIMEATLKLIPIETPEMVVETVRTKDLTGTMTQLEEFDLSHRYTVAWVDMTTSDSSVGRGVVDGGDHSAGHRGNKDVGKSRDSFRVTTPVGVPSGLINRRTVTMFNRLWYRRAPDREVRTSSMDSFFYPLDAVKEWNRIYGHRGFVQYQFVVPFGAEQTLEAIVHALARSASVPALAVLKRFGPGAGLLSFPTSGWTLAVDLPAGKSGLAETLDDADRRVARAGGRIYLAKDARSRPEFISEMYPELDKWREIADRYDPTRRFRSDLDRRLHLRDKP